MKDTNPAKGASKSLNKTITELMEYLDDSGPRPRQGLREFLYGKVGDLAEKWFRKGFNRGHKESYAAYLDDGVVPVRLEYLCSRNVCPNEERQITLKSTIRTRSGKSRKLSVRKSRRHN